MHKFFVMPKVTKITNRTSSITNAFVNSIIPNNFPIDDDLKVALDILGMSPDDIRCSYCGDKATEWDHLRPVVDKKRPTGFISELRNLVPACGKCNQSKGNRYWKEWMSSDAKLSIKTRKIENLEAKIERLDAYEEWGNVTALPLEELCDTELWERHWKNHDKIIELMKESQKLAELIKFKIGQRIEQTKAE